MNERAASAAAVEEGKGSPPVWQWFSSDAKSSVSFSFLLVTKCCEILGTKPTFTLSLGPF